MKPEHILYTKLPDGSIKKTITRIEDIQDVNEEIRVINRQLKDIIAGVPDTPKEIEDTQSLVDNYTTQVAVLSEGIDPKVLEELLADVVVPTVPTHTVPLTDISNIK